MPIGPPSVTRFGRVNRTLPDVSTVARACDSYLHAFVKTLTGVATGYTNGTGGAPPASSNWSVLRSSNGTTANNGDQFSAAFTPGEWLSAANGTAHSWFVLQSPSSPGITDGPWYIFVSKNNATATTFTISLSKTAWTGGTNLNDPTNAGVVSTTGAVVNFNTSSTTAGKTHYYTDAAGNFGFLCSRDGSGVIETWFLFSQLEQTQPSGDTNRVLGYAGHSTSGLFNGVASTVISGTQLLGFHRNGAAQSANLFLTGYNISGLSELNPVTSEVEGFKYGGVFSTLTGNHMIRGFFPDLYNVSTQPANSAVLPDVNPLWSLVGSPTTGGKMAIPLPAIMSL